MPTIAAKAIIGALAVFWLSTASAQDVTVAELKSKGATVLNAEELKQFLSGATVRYENAQNVTQIKFESDGSLNGSAERRIGSAGTRQFTGAWRVTDTGRWCGIFRAFGGGGGDTKYCRDVLKLGDQYYYSGGKAGDDQRPAFAMTVSR